MTVATMTNAQPAKGIACPKCGDADVMVWKTHRKPGRIQRRRVCRKCGWRFTTTEKTIGVVP